MFNALSVFNAGPPGGGPTPDPGPPPIVYDPTEQEARIREAIAAALRRLPAFDGVYFGAFAGIDGHSAEDRRAVAIEPMDSTSTPSWDAGDGGQVIDCRTRITILARDRDGERCDSITGAMFASAYNELLKTSLGGLVLPEHSVLSRWTWQKPKAPERRVEATFQCRYLIDVSMLEDE